MQFDRDDVVEFPISRSSDEWLMIDHQNHRKQLTQYLCYRR